MEQALIAPGAGGDKGCATPLLSSLLWRGARSRASLSPSLPHPHPRPLQVPYQRLLQLILVLGIGGSFQVGFQLSMITYTSVVSSTRVTRRCLQPSLPPPPPVRGSPTALPGWRHLPVGLGAGPPGSRSADLPQPPPAWVACPRLGPGALWGQPCGGGQRSERSEPLPCRADACALPSST